jgi:5'-nucleotidase
MPFDSKISGDKFRRGLIIDKRRGNIIKIDRHKYVRKVYHGLEELSTQTRKSTYSQQVASFTENHYVNIDTIFLLVGKCIFPLIKLLLEVSPDRCCSVCSFG